jgi:hypothetical protein
MYRRVHDQCTRIWNDELAERVQSELERVRARGHAEIPLTLDWLAFFARHKDGACDVEAVVSQLKKNEWESPEMLEGSTLEDFEGVLSPLRGSCRALALRAFETIQLLWQASRHEQSQRMSEEARASVATPVQPGTHRQPANPVVALLAAHAVQDTHRAFNQRLHIGAMGGTFNEEGRAMTDAGGRAFGASLANSMGVTGNARTAMAITGGVSLDFVATFFQEHLETHDTGGVILQHALGEGAADAVADVAQAALSSML